MNDAAPSPVLAQEVWQRPFVTAHQRWCRDFVLELRLRDVPGPVIGERLAEVEVHCTESGETPAEAFGDPTGYAGQIDGASGPRRVTGVWKVAVLAATQVLALVVGTAGVRAWATGGQLGYDAVQVACLGLFLAVLLVLPSLLRPLLQHPWTVGAPLLVLVLLGSAGPALSGRLDLPAVVHLPAPAVSVGLLAVVLVLAWAEHRELARDAGDDLVTSPLEPAAAVRQRRLRRTALVPAGLVPLAYLALATTHWLTA